MYFIAYFVSLICLFTTLKTFMYWVTEDWVVGNFTVFSVTLSPIMLHNNITHTYLTQTGRFVCRLKGRAFFMKISVVLLHSALKFEKSVIIYSKAVLYLFVTSQRQKTSSYDFFVGMKLGCYKRMGKNSFSSIFLIFEHCARHITLNVWMLKHCANVNFISFVWETMEKKMG